MRQAGTQTIALVSDSVSSPRLAGDMMDGALAAARRHGVTLLFGETEGDAGLERTLIETMHGYPVDGIILASVHTRTSSVPAGLDAGPAVLLNVVPREPSPLRSILPDEVRGGQAAARVLLDAGHGEGIHVIGAGLDGDDVPPGRTTAIDRLAGIRQELGEMGVEVESGRAVPVVAAGARVRRDPRTAGQDAPAGVDLPGRPARVRRLPGVAGRRPHRAGRRLRSLLRRPPHRLVAAARSHHRRPAHHELGAKAVDLLFAPAEPHDAVRSDRGRTHRVPMPVRVRDSVAPPR